MRRFALAGALLLSLVIPAAVSAAPGRCSVAISPDAGSPTDAYRITVSNMPIDPQGGSVEVRLDVGRLGSRGGTIFIVAVVPGFSEFYVDYNFSYPGEPPLDPLAPGRYQVSATTAHLAGRAACHAVAQFIVN